MPNPYMRAVLAEQQAKRPKRPAEVAPSFPPPGEEKAAKSAEKSDTTASPKEN